MAYIRSSDRTPISADVLRQLAQLLDLPLPAEDVEPVAAALTDQLAAVDVLATLDLADIAIPGTFDPRWHE
jgi:hypothetical protein